MLKSKSGILAVAALSLLLCGASSQADSPRKSKGEKQWVELFNGKDLAGWKMIGKGSFVVEDGALASRGGVGLGLLWYEARTFRDFVLQVEWKVGTECSNSGVFVRFPEKSEDPWYSVHNGYEIQIDDCDKRGLKNQTGSIYDFSPATARAAKPAGQWNLYEISVVGQRYTVILNGQKVNEFEGSRGLEGYIGLQSHDPVSKVWYRSVRVREIK
ncbi:MAG TPA: DUF1080 domain-containing protein [Blastocatellia bacterium]|nr:DUF1080 domain-containing protein [Blastocatellia bacterium]